MSITEWRDGQQDRHIDLDDKFVLTPYVPVGDIELSSVSLKVKDVLHFCCVWELYMEEWVCGYCLMLM